MSFQLLGPLPLKDLNLLWRVHHSNVWMHAANTKAAKTAPEHLLCRCLKYWNIAKLFSGWSSLQRGYMDKETANKYDFFHCSIVQFVYLIVYLYHFSLITEVVSCFFTGLLKFHPTARSHLLTVEELISIPFSFKSPHNAEAVLRRSIFT